MSSTEDLDEAILYALWCGMLEQWHMGESEAALRKAHWLLGQSLSSMRVVACCIVIASEGPIIDAVSWAVEAFEALREALRAMSPEEAERMAESIEAVFDSAQIVLERVWAGLGLDNDEDENDDEEEGQQVQNEDEEDEEEDAAILETSQD